MTRQEAIDRLVIIRELAFWIYRELGPQRHVPNKELIFKRIVDELDEPLLLELESHIPAAQAAKLADEQRRAAAESDVQNFKTNFASFLDGLDIANLTQAQALQGIRLLLREAKWRYKDEI